MILNCHEPFWRLVDKTETCWEWRGAKNKGGYGLSAFNGKQTSAHRVAWQKLRPDANIDGLDLDHLCRNRSCVNPDHLEPVSHKENCHRGNGWSGVNVRKTHCKHGHEFTIENTILEKLGRKCRVCNNERVKIRGKQKYWQDPERGREVSREKNIRRRTKNNESEGPG